MFQKWSPGPVAQSVASQTAVPKVESLILAVSHTFVEKDHEIISTVIPLFKKGGCQLQVRVCSQSTGQLIGQACPGRSVVR